MISIEDTRKKVHSLMGQIQKGSFEDAENTLADVLMQIQKDYQNLEISVPKNTDIAQLIQEMRYGFQQMDKRFEAMDKRFDDLIHQMDKRFEQVDRRFEQVEKRFEQFDKRFAFMQWTFGTMLSLLGLLMSILLVIAGFKNLP